MNTDNELALKTWVLTGNAVNEVLNGLSDSQTALRANVAALQDQLRDIPADLILDRITTLPANDRDLLIAICEKCLDILGSESLARLGLEQIDAEPVLTYLRSI